MSVVLHIENDKRVLFFIFFVNRAGNSKEKHKKVKTRASILLSPIHPLLDVHPSLLHDMLEGHVPRLELRGSCKHSPLSQGAESV